MRDNHPYPPVTAGDTSPDDEIDLRKHVLVLWRYRWLIVLGTLVCAVAAFVAGLLTPRTYEATAQLIVSPPKMEATQTAPTISVPTFRALVENQSLCARMVQEFGLDKEPYRVTTGRFISDHLKIETMRDTSVIIVKVRLWDPVLAAKVANRLAEAAEQLAERLNQEEAVSTRDVIKAQLDQSQKRLDDAQQHLETFKQQAQLDLLRKDVDALLSQRGTLLSLLVDIQTEKARLSQAEALFKQRDKIETLRRSIDTDPAAMEAVRRNAGEPAAVLPLQLRNEYVNPVYENLDQVIATSRTRLAGLEKQKSELIDVRRLDADKQAKLTLLYERETELTRLQTEYELSRSVYMDVAIRYEQARIQVAGRSPQLQLMDAALPPDRPVSRHVVRDTALAMFTGLLLTVVAALCLDAARRTAGRDQAAR